MDLHLKQWRNQQESEQHQHPSASSGSASVLPFFVPEPNNKICNLSAFPDSNTASFSSRLPRMGSHFSLGQWQELELQALIFRYMLAGAAVPPELFNPIKKSLLHASPYFLHPHYQHYQPALLQSGYWGRAAMDPEPGRCRRTDGKKWRCSRDVVAGHKYCERHMHRGRNRSRKPVEIPTTTTTANSGVAGKTMKITSATHLALSEPSPSINLLHLKQSSSEFNTENKGIIEVQNEVTELNRSDGRILRRFFDDWPRSLEESDSVVSNSSPLNSSTDVSLKLSTGVGDDSGEHEQEQHQQQVNWGTGWGANQVASMGGPLAEALRSSASTSSPTSVLHQLPRASASETSYIST